MPFAYPRFEKSRLVWWNCKEIPPLPCKDLPTKSKICSRHLSSTRMDYNWKSFLLLKGKKFQLFGLAHKHESGILSSWSQFFHAQRLLSHKVISPADWEVAGICSIPPQNSTLSEAAVAHELEALYSTVGIHLQQQTFTSQNTAVGREGTVCKCQN